MSGPSTRTFLRYLLWQLPGWALLAVVICVAVIALELPAWAGVTAGLLVVGRDVALYPVLRRTFDSPPYRPQPIGAEAMTLEPLAPTGYVKVQGELWEARAPDPARRIPAGRRVVVRGADRLMLVVEEPGGARGDRDDG